MNGVAGLTLTGRNGNAIFLPAAGMYWFDDILGAGEDGNYWSSTMGQYSGIYCACDMNFLDGGQGRSEGKSVRPVIDEADNINLPEAFSGKSSQAIYNLYGIKVADTMADISTPEINGDIQAKIVKIFDIMKLFYKNNVNKLLIFNVL